MARLRDKLKIFNSCLILLIVTGCASFLNQPSRVPSAIRTNDLCKLLFENSAYDQSIWRFVPDQNYQLVYSENLEELDGVFIRTFKDELGIVWHEFFDGFSRKNIQIMAHDIFDVAPIYAYNRASGQISEQIIPLERYEQIEVDEIIKRHKEFKSVAKNDILNILTPDGSIPSLGTNVFELIRRGDNEFLKFGFTLPEKTEVFLGGVRDSRIGPFTKYFSLNEGNQTLTLIIMNPLPGRESVVRDASIILHERAHTVIRKNYEYDELLNRDKAINEALADYFSAHILDNPKLGQAATFNEFPSRDIFARTINNGEIVSRIVRLDQAVGANYYTHSLFYSNTLWKIRTRIGERQMESFLPEILREFNNKYALLRRGAFDHPPLHVENGVQNEFNENFHLFLAVIKKQAKLKSLDHQIDPLITSTIEEVGGSTQKLNELLSYL